jgi:hypothetical protein
MMIITVAIASISTKWSKEDILFFDRMVIQIESTQFLLHSTVSEALTVRTPTNSRDSLTTVRTLFDRTLRVIASK